jgi:outer membrane protein TolC
MASPPWAPDNRPVHEQTGRTRSLPSLLELSLALILIAPGRTDAQTRLSIDDAIARATTQSTVVRVSTAEEREAGARRDQARAGLWPTVDFAESWQRGDQPLFVFSSLVAQGRLTNPAAAGDAYAGSAAISNYRSVFSIDAPIFDPAVRASIRIAELGVNIAAVRREAAQQDVALAVVAAYGSVVDAVARRRVVGASLDSARSDLALAEQRRDQGLVTDADVLQMQLHLAAARERAIRAEADETVARARLNQIIGAAIDDTFVVDDLAASVASLTPVANDEMTAVRTRPEARLAALNQSLADATRAAARAAFLPRISALASWEANGGQWNARSSGWTAGVVARTNLFRGFADRARLAEAAELQHRRDIEREGIDNAIRVDVRETRARLDAAIATADVAEAAVAQAVESHRIIRDRYEGGLTDISALLRAAEGVQAAEARRVTAHVEAIVATAAWRRATGQ